MKVVDGNAKKGNEYMKTDHTISRRSFLGGMFGVVAVPAIGSTELLDRMYQYYTRFPNDMPSMILSPTFRARLGQADEHYQGIHDYLVARRQFGEMLIAARSNANVILNAQHSSSEIMLVNPADVVEAYARRLGNGDYRFAHIPQEAYWEHLENTVRPRGLASKFIRFLRRPEVKFFGKAIKWALRLAGISSFAELPGRVLNEWAQNRVSRDENPVLSWVSVPPQTGYPISTNDVPMIYANDQSLHKAYYPEIFARVASKLPSIDTTDKVVGHSQGILLLPDSISQGNSTELKVLQTPTGNKVYYASESLPELGGAPSEGVDGMNLTGVADPNDPSYVEFTVSEFAPKFA